MNFNQAPYVPGRPKGPQRTAKGSPWALQREPKGPKGRPKGAQGLPKESKGAQSRPRGRQRRPKDTQRKPKEAKGKRYISKNSRSTAQADVMLWYIYIYIYIWTTFFRSNRKKHLNGKKTFQDSYIFNDFLWILLQNWSESGQNGHRPSLRLGPFSTPNCSEMLWIQRVFTIFGASQPMHTSDHGRGKSQASEIN